MTPAEELRNAATKLPVGRPVRYWTGVRDGEGKISRTRTEVQMLGGHTPVVWVDGEASAIALTHVEAIDVYPAQIGVFCDRCGITTVHDYLVSDDMDKAARFAVARRHLNAHDGWSCTDAGDFCPSCAGGKS